MKIPPLASAAAPAAAKSAAPAPVVPVAVKTTSPIPPPAQKAPAAVAKAALPVISTETIFQRLRYFENLAVLHERYIDELKAKITSLGAAVPSAYFAPLSGPGGSHTPKSG